MIDGFQIRTLVATMIYRLCPTLIEKGYVYIAETPLFEITYMDGKNEKTFFAFDDAEKNDFMAKNAKKVKKIQRSKGLGENDEDMMWETTMNPENRRLIRLESEDVEKMNEYFELFLGNNVAVRKNYIEENGHLYMDYIDVD